MPLVLEHGDVFFAYRPRVGEDHAGGLEDVQRLWMILSPRDRPLHRRIVIGKKRLPRRGQRHWGYVEQVATDPARLVDDLHETHYWTKTRGMRRQAIARAAGEGVYALAADEDDGAVRLIYRLELPEQVGEVQDALGIAEQAAYIATAFATSGRRKFTPVVPALLDEVGTEIILIAAENDLGVRLEIDRVIADSADLFRGLAIEDGEHPLRPLFEGLWA
jgi:hypothetical protein